MIKAHSILKRTLRILTDLSDVSNLKTAFNELNLKPEVQVYLKEQATLENLEAQKQKTQADADFYTNSKMVSAGLTPQQRAEYEMKTKIGMMEALSKIVLPSTYMSGSNSGSGSASMLESILGVKLLNMDNLTAPKK